MDNFQNCDENQHQIFSKQWPDFKSTSSLTIYSPFFTYLKYVGILPYKITSEELELDEAKPPTNESTTKSTSQSSKQTLYGNLNCENSVSHRRLGIISKLSYESHGFFANLAYGFIFSYSVYVVFALVQLIRHLMQMGENSSKITLELLLWCSSTIVSLMMTVKFHMERDRLCKVISRAGAVQLEIFGTIEIQQCISFNFISLANICPPERLSFCFLDHYRNQDVLQAIRNHTKNFQRLSFSTLIVTILAVVVMVLKHQGDPYFPGFLNSLMNSEQEGKLWFQYFSLFREIVNQLYSWATVGQFALTYTIISRTIEYCLVIISCRNNVRSQQLVSTIVDKNGNGMSNPTTFFRPTFDTTAKDMKNVIVFYQKLASIIADFNELFSTLISHVLGGTLVVCCVFAYVPLRHWKSTPISGMLFYIFSFFSLFLILSQFYPVLGMAYVRSIEFQRSWLTWLSSERSKQFGKNNDDGNRKCGCKCEENQEFHRLKLRLEACYPIGFKCGEYFIMRPSTMLTFFSVISTYLIIMLQFDL